MSNFDRSLPPTCLCLVTAWCPPLARPAKSRLPRRWWMPMDTSLSARLNKPTFGTSDFAVSSVDPSEYIDATAEETCPAESAPMSEPQRAAGEITETPSAASLEVMDQLKALAQNVTQAN